MNETVQYINHDLKMRLDLKLLLTATVIILCITYTIYITGLLDDQNNKKDFLTDLNSYISEIRSSPRYHEITTAAQEPPTVHVASNVPHVHANLHPDNLTLIDIKNFKLNINQDICNVSEIGLVTIIHSAVENTEARRIIRETWGNPNIPGVNTRLVFLLGMVSDVGLQKPLLDEAMRFKDIVQGDFLDTYHNLSYKNVFGKLWVSEFCEQADFVVKTDDDMFIDLYATYFFTRQYLKSPQYVGNSFLLCPVWHGMPVLRETNSKWYVSYDDLSKEEAPGNYYPPYCSGWIYILTPGTAGRLADVAGKAKFLWIDDAWVTGYLVKELKFKHLDMMRFFNMGMEKGLLFKSIQNPEIYHKDFLAVPSSRNFEIAYTLNAHARWCYVNKCFNNIYSPQANLSSIDVIPDDTVNRVLNPKL
ncbi:beta-1,3-galactosyltransferase 1 isoform X2 [Eurytemora carolleeae]|uniref:beta-1,3-galactosyltransferase 1 isoform X2 n=1 Tax=Eurytemora carolleeae TaxID=1294199 RepID=UPI000C789077|nr:beta-1,3-galactosyltransferase 1 isoform X2 [Eurytemora carolleeae]|eukprot:XP_023330623.1 beta-1,3-galactosyltransferase 1-like isoform X2 [Eurytemora affinis]